MLTFSGLNIYFHRFSDRRALVYAKEKFDNRSIVNSIIRSLMFDHELFEIEFNLRSKTTTLIN